VLWVIFEKTEKFYLISCNAEQLAAWTTNTKFNQQAKEITGYPDCEYDNDRLL
jgi:hypothetical protein